MKNHIHLTHPFSFDWNFGLENELHSVFEKTQNSDFFRSLLEDSIFPSKDIEIRTLTALLITEE